MSRAVRPGLLVSVRDAEEAAAALAGGASIIDVKEPRNGPLGAADSATIAAVHERVAGQVPTSAALGELVDGDPLARAAALPAGLAFAKLGLRGARPWRDWPERWRKSLAHLPRGTQGVAVVYADAAACDAPEMLDVLQAAREAGCRAALVDTYDKSGPSLTAAWTCEQVAEFINSVRQAQMTVVVAGSLRAQDLATWKAPWPDFFAVRGAACREGRESTVDTLSVARLVAAIKKQLA